MRRDGSGRTASAASLARYGRWQATNPTLPDIAHEPWRKQRRVLIVEVGLIERTWDQQIWHPTTGLLTRNATWLLVPHRIKKVPWTTTKHEPAGQRCGEKLARVPKCMAVASPDRGFSRDEPYHVLNAEDPRAPAQVWQGGLHMFADMTANIQEGEQAEDWPATLTERRATRSDSRTFDARTSTLEGELERLEADKQPETVTSKGGTGQAASSSTEQHGQAATKLGWNPLGGGWHTIPEMLA